MRRLDRYILRELMIPFLIGTAAVVLMFQANMLIAQLKQFQLQSVPITAILQIVLYKTPSFLNMTLPVGMALAASLAVSRLVRESELIAVRATGTSILRVMVPIALFGAVVAFASWVLVERVVPQAERKFRKVQTEAAIIGASPNFRANVIVYLRDWTASFGSVSAGSDKGFMMTDIMLVSRETKGEIKLVTAKTGTYRDGVWELHDVYGRVIAGENLISARPEDDIVISDRITVKDFFSPPDSSEMSTADLLKAIREGKLAGRDMTMNEVDYHTRYSLPAACAVFALVGPVFAVWLSRSGAFVGVFLSTIICFLYFNVYVISTQILAKNGVLSPVLAAWLPNVLFVVLGIVALRRLE
jgi:lipopolysaccharide export system permease protein